MNIREFKTSLYKEMSGMTKALGNPHRLEILDLLAQGPVPVEYIAVNTNLTVANASQHLQVLKNAMLVVSEKRGKYNYYKLANEQVFKSWCALRRLGFSQNEEINNLFNDFRKERSELKTISRDELIQKIKTDSVVIVDVRPEEEFINGHIENALSYPLNELRKKMSELPKNKEIVAYCRGPLCMMADVAVMFLSTNGYKASRLEHGFPDWEAEGMPVEKL
ncbi:metalloregulator ArsR/SmtB family transcription factor [Rhodohalobacter sp.]|uniref:ArsR/SmtB family transcription factor n=1 Tax=Rhodohalobacter sp. TaxID=1974210 RepID=UPI002ACD7FF7|nr:metalloregulator ArsR/SmtB family transcription factor [Rhodohalobacter sp.]MDZ7757317.1 metalloregulator ArsR/SmtB family transcription factor [Rhodohalobacter sp.]